jgi:hypothetical protein
VFEKPQPVISDITREESNALKSLKCNRDIMMLPDYKRNFTVIMNEFTCMQKDEQTPHFSLECTNTSKRHNFKNQKKSTEAFIPGQIRASY